MAEKLRLSVFVDPELDFELYQHLTSLRPFVRAEFIRDCVREQLNISKLEAEAAQNRSETKMKQKARTSLLECDKGDLRSNLSTIDKESDTDLYIDATSIFGDDFNR